MDKEIQTALSGTVTNFRATLPAGGVSLKGFSCDNLNNTATTYLNVYGVPAASVVIGTTVPIFSFPIAASAAVLEGGQKHLFLGQAITGLSANVSTTRGGSTSPSSTCHVALYFEQ